jgi:hypothetical protein
MRARSGVLLLAAGLLPCAFAQFQLSSVQGSTEHAVGSVYDWGTIFTGERASTLFRVLNISSAPAELNVLSVAGTGFSLGNAPTLPITLKPQTSVDFTVNFLASERGSYSAALRLVGISVLLLITVQQGITIAVETPTGLQPLGTAPVDFGPVELGGAAGRSFEIGNPTTGVLAVPDVEVQGTDFRISSPPGRTTLGSGERTTFDIEFRPTAIGARTGTLGVGGRSYVLAGTGLPAVLPAPQLTVSLPAAASGQQGKVTVTLDEAAKTSATGTVTLDFRPARPGASDPAIAFSSGGQSTEFRVDPGDTQGHFGDGTAAFFQTGTTAGTLVFTANLGGHSDQETITIAPAPVGVVAVQVARSARGVDVGITGFDNTRTAGALTFTFFDAAGRVVAPGAIQADATADFARYFESSNVGGSFQIRAAFPVNGDASQLKSVEAGIGNSAGTTVTGRTPF